MNTSITKRIVLSIMMVIMSLNAVAADKSSEEARKLFEKAYNMVFGPSGSSLTYSVNIIGLYKTHGDIIYKGKKSRYIESRYDAINDGTTVYKADKKKKTVDVYRADDENQDKYFSKFKANLSEFQYSYKTEGNYYIITAKNKNAGLTGIKEIQAKVYKSNFHPVSLKIKIALFSTTVKITKFKSGGISDSEFVFQKQKYEGYSWTDHR